METQTVSQSINDLENIKEVEKMEDGDGNETSTKLNDKGKDDKKEVSFILR